MSENPSTLPVTIDHKTPQERTRSYERRVFTGVTACCQLMLNTGCALFEFALPPDSRAILIGREKQNVQPSIDIDLEPFNAHSLGVSRMHCRFERAGSRLFLRDLNSTNGTWVNGNKLKPMEVYDIQHGDKIDFGRLGAQIYIKS